MVSLYVEASEKGWRVAVHEKSNYTRVLCFVKLIIVAVSERHLDSIKANKFQVPTTNKNTAFDTLEFLLD